MRAATLSLCFLTVTGSAWAGEYIVLANGFRIHAASHTLAGAVLRIQTADGAIEIPAGSVKGFEQEDYVAPAVSAALAAQKAPFEAPKAALSPQELITKAAQEAGLPPEIVHSVARAESGYHTDAVSPKGAIGLMQLMPATAAELNANPYDPSQNAEAGARYLRDLLVKYQSDPHQVTKAIAAYNAGPGAVDKYNGIPPYRETIEYVQRVLAEYTQLQRQNATR
jgi:soluble lytic murein transglycosylase-like protein